MIIPEADRRTGQINYVARCDDCNAVVAVATTERAVALRISRRTAGHWRPGLPIFCPDQHACAERVWQRYGRHMQALIDEMEQTRQRVAGELRQAAQAVVQPARRAVAKGAR